MEDVDESSSENSNVSGIVNFDESPHHINKHAYKMTLLKDVGSNDFRSRIEFNLGPIQNGYCSTVIEYFPVVMSNVSVTAQATSVSINSQTTKTFTTNTKTLVQSHKWINNTPNFLFLLDLHGSAPGGSRVLAGLHDRLWC